MCFRLKGQAVIMNGHNLPNHYINVIHCRVAVYGMRAVPERWIEVILSCRPETGKPHVHHPRPKCFWPTDALELADRLGK